MSLQPSSVQVGPLSTGAEVTHAPLAHVCPAPHVAQAAPCVPQPPVVVPGSHCPSSSQHPPQVDAQLAASLGASAGARASASLLSSPLSPPV
jgi:hypothetical protein